jgi:hypothetical protein
MVRACGAGCVSAKKAERWLSLRRTRRASEREGWMIAAAGW